MEKLYFKLVPGAGGHRLGNGDEAFIVKDDVIIETDKELDVLFVNKFERVGSITKDANVVRDPSMQTVKSVMKKKDDEVPTNEVVGANLGNEVTHQFELAKDKGVQIYEHEKGFSVYKDNKLLVTKKVQSNIRKYLKTL